MMARFCTLITAAAAALLLNVADTHVQHNQDLLEEALNSADEQLNALTHRIVKLSQQLDDLVTEQEEEAFQVERLSGILDRQEGTLPFAKPRQVAGQCPYYPCRPMALGGKFDSATILPWFPSRPKIMAEGEAAPVNLAYGDILEQWENVAPDDAGLLKIAKFAVEYALKRHPTSVCVGGDSSEVVTYEISNGAKLELVLIEDGPTSAGPLGLGFIYSFRTKWPSIPNSFTHSFTVTKSSDGNLYMFEHTFHSEQEVSDGAHPERGSRENADSAFSILTYNIWNYNSVKRTIEDYLARIKHVGQLVQSSGADIIGFQEIRFHEGKGGPLGPSQLQHLADHLQEYQFVFQPAHTEHRFLPKRSEEGVAIFSKFPILSHDYLLLPRNKSDPKDLHQRVLLHAEIVVPQLGKVHVFNTHLPSGSEPARKTAVLNIWEHIRKYQGPVYLLGDLNAAEDREEMMFLMGKGKLIGTTTEGMHDVWKMKQHESQDNGSTYSALDELSERIDYIFMKEDKCVEFSDVSLLDDGTRKMHAASDHLGVLAHFIPKATV